MGPEHHLFGKP